MFRSGFTAFIFIAILLLLDFYFFQAVKTVAQNLSGKAKQGIAIAYWSITVLTILSFLLFAFTDPELLGRKMRSYLFAMVIGMFLAKIVGCLFFLVDDIRRIFQWVISRVIYSSGTASTMDEEGISRSTFISWLGVGMGTALFGSLIYGFRNKYRYHINNVSLKYPNLPPGFDGLRIVQISDVHSGSFTNKAAVSHGVDMILAQKPDLILFTGDLVNDMAIEMKDYKDVFSRLKAPMGVYSVLGNHDYGDYVQWPHNGLSKTQNLSNLMGTHARLGWRLLMNEHLVFSRGDDRIALIGIENWSAKARFPKHGRMDLAYPGTEHVPFKILMSHDPSHWAAEVQPKYNDIDLTLSGHTHGMQFGVEIPGLKWSPVEYVYKEWAGLYEHDRQKLYVNRGFGFIGYPGRVGILPEITVLTLNKS